MQKCNNCSCACVSLCTTVIQDRTVLIIFPVIPDLRYCLLEGRGYIQLLLVLITSK